MTVRSIGCLPWCASPHRADGLHYSAITAVALPREAPVQVVADGRLQFLPDKVEICLVQDLDAAEPTVEVMKSSLTTTEAAIRLSLDEAEQLITALTAVVKNGRAA